MATCKHGISGYCGACCLLDEPVNARDGITALVAQVAELTQALEAAERESDEAARRSVQHRIALADANTLLREAPHAPGVRGRAWQSRVDAHLSACTEGPEARVEALETLLAASEARAAQWQADAESYRADATVAQDRLAALRVRVDQAKQLASEALRDSDDSADALAHVLDHLNG